MSNAKIIGQIASGLIPKLVSSIGDEIALQRNKPNIQRLIKNNALRVLQIKGGGVQPTPKKVAKTLNNSRAVRKALSIARPLMQQTEIPAAIATTSKSNTKNSENINTSFTLFSSLPVTQTNAFKKWLFPVNPGLSTFGANCEIANQYSHYRGKAGLIRLQYKPAVGNNVTGQVCFAFTSKVGDIDAEFSAWEQVVNLRGAVCTNAYCAQNFNVQPNYCNRKASELLVRKDGKEVDAYANYDCGTLIIATNGFTATQVSLGTVTVVPNMTVFHPSPNVAATATFAQDYNTNATPADMTTHINWDICDLYVARNATSVIMTVKGSFNATLAVHGSGVIPGTMALNLTDAGGNAKTCHRWFDTADGNGHYGCSMWSLPSVDYGDILTFTTVPANVTSYAFTWNRVCMSDGYTSSTSTCW